MSSGTEVWSTPRCVAFRFGALFAALMILPFPLDGVPGTGWLAAAWQVPWTLGVKGLGMLLGLPTPTPSTRGSSDSLFAYLQVLLFILVAAFGALLWSLLDRRRTAYPRLARGLHVYLRYWLAKVMLGFGLAKLFALQFRVPIDLLLDQRLGDKSPMGLLWAFIGLSRPYTIFLGVAEMLGALLLLSRRTTTMGALLLVAVLTNVVVLDLCYDVPVKLDSIQFLVAAGALIAPDSRRLLAALLGHGTRKVPRPPRMALHHECLRLAAKLALLGGLATGIFLSFASVPSTPAGDLDGGWQVQRFSLDGVDRAPLTTDTERWRRVFFGAAGRRPWIWIRFMTDQQMRLQASIDAATRTIRLESEDGGGDGTLGYGRPDADHVVLDGTFAGHRCYVVLERLPAWPLMTRGFHWIQQDPFNH